MKKYICVGDYINRVLITTRDERPPIYLLQVWVWVALVKAIQFNLHNKYKYDMSVSVNMVDKINII
jgi:hypothetical protein